MRKFLMYAVLVSSVLGHIAYLMLADVPGSSGTFNSRSSSNGGSYRSWGGSSGSGWGGFSGGHK